MQRRKRFPAKVLFATELGANLGHVMPLSRLAKQLKLDGIHPIFATGNLEAAKIALADSGINFVQAPVWPSWHVLGGNQDGHSSYLDVLAQIGFADLNKLTSILGAWKTLIELIQPDVVVLDHSPALSSLLNALKIPVIAVGNGFTLPPIEYDFFPAHRADRSPLLPEKNLYRSLVKSLEFYSLPIPDRLIDGIFPKERIVCSFPELDFYKHWRNEKLYAPLDTLPCESTPAKKLKLFVYLGAELPGFDNIVRCLAEMDCAVECYLRGVPENLRVFLEMRGHVVHESPPELSTVITRSTHILSQGGNNICHAVMSSGRPHFIIPLHGESEFNLNTLMNMNIARRIPLGLSAEVLKKQLEDYMADHELFVRCKQWSSLISARIQPSGFDALSSKLSQLL